MKKFLILLLRSALIGISFSILIYYFALNINFLKVNENDFYDLFENIHDGSIIAGTSRSRYFFNSKSFDNKYNMKNFSFSVGMSSYDDSYTLFLKKFVKQNPLKKNITILTVDPYSLSNDTILKNQYFSKFNFEKSDFSKFNFEYISKEKITPFTIIEENIKNLLRFWIYGNYYQKDFREISEIEKELSNTDPPKKITNYSLKKIEALILHFKKTSNVFIIRTPVVKKFYHFENKYSPNFNNMIDSISEKYKVHYFDLNKNINFSTDLKFYDLYHLNKRFSKSATKNVEKIIDSIKWDTN